jgi:hypothetical protein
MQNPRYLQHPRFTQSQRLTHTIPETHTHNFRASDNIRDTLAHTCVHTHTHTHTHTPQQWGVLSNSGRARAHTHTPSTRGSAQVSRPALPPLPSNQMAPPTKRWRRCPPHTAGLPYLLQVSTSTRPTSTCLKSILPRPPQQSGPATDVLIGSAARLGPARSSFHAAGRLRRDHADTSRSHSPAPSLQGSATGRALSR